jgi:phosphatidylserine/phosphatidylglycerophosphate/cardiolipin synthase-like enzyme
MNDLITNGTEIKQRILSEISTAKQCIYIAMAYFTDREIAMAIVEAKNRNITVDIILSSNNQNETVKLMLKGANINVHAFDTGDARGIMHHKFCLIDSKISINGSYNYSLNASTNNVENIQVSDDITTYSQFLSEFDRLKYNIDNNIGVNETSKIPETKIQQVQPINIIDTFSQQLHNLVYLKKE